MEVAKLQRYDLVERIAAGGMGEVFRARAIGPHGFEKTLAVKRILPELSSDPEFVDRFVRESKLAVSLSHANVVQVFDLGRTDDDLFLVMEYVHGTDLARLLLAVRAAGSLMPLGLALHIASEAAKGLAYAHSRYDLEGAGRLGVIHCDISPSNLLLSYAGEVKLTDFGVAQLVDPTRRTPRTPGEAQLVMGKWRYMAPEQLRGEPVDARTDLYALGVVLYEMLTGRKAFGGEGIKATCDQVLAGGVPPVSTFRPEVPPALDAFVSRVMALDPNDRPQDSRAFLSELAEIQRMLPEPVTALDLGAYVSRMVPPPPEPPRRTALSALLQPMVVERSGPGRGLHVRRNRPAASFVPRADPSGSQAITQWIPTDEPAPGWRLSEFTLWNRRLRWRLGTAALTALMLLGTALGVGLATGLKMRRSVPLQPPLHAEGPSPPEERLVSTERLLWRQAPLLSPVERIPAELASLLPSRRAGRSATSSAPRPRSPGYLDIYVEPWAHVLLDGRPLDRPTPITKLPVRPGNHHLVLENPILKKTKRVEVTVSQGQTHRVELYWVEK
ncbi:MAG: serine/threonine protein kinase [Myxococcota bacterium]|nr:serine/threonine protein kinase [Myxococcota bacterium]